MGDGGIPELPLTGHALQPFGHGVEVPHQLRRLPDRLFIQQHTGVEPILFGAPIIMNPVFFLPFILVPMINAILAWSAVDLGLVEKVVMLTAWTTPAPIGASWATNWAFSPVIMCFICMGISALMYYPFVRAYERTLLKQEAETAEAEEAARSEKADTITPIQSQA